MHIPATHRNVDLQDHSLFPVRTESGTDTLQSLCLVNKANLPAVRALMHGMDNLLKDAAKAVPPTTSGLSVAPSDMTTSCTFHPGFMSDPAVTAAVAESLDKDYQQACVRSIDVDERPFLGRAIEAPPTPGPSAAPPSLAKCLVGSPQRQAQTPPPHPGPCKLCLDLANLAWHCCCGTSKHAISRLFHALICPISSLLAPLLAHCNPTGLCDCTPLLLASLYSSQLGFVSVVRSELAAQPVQLSQCIALSRLQVLLAHQSWQLWSCIQEAL